MRKRRCRWDRELEDGSQDASQGTTHLKMGLRAPLPPAWRSCFVAADGAVWCWRLKRSDVARGTVRVTQGEQTQLGMR